MYRAVAKVGCALHTLSLTVLLVLLLPALCSAATYTVDDDAPADYDKIQDAINAAADGDIVKVFQGRYYENIDFRGKAITVTSTDPNDPNVVENTIIDANGDGIVVSFHMGEDPNSEVTGFTITGGHAKYGSGICCWDSSPMICNCIITNNFSEDIVYSAGAGIYCSGGTAIISNCSITQNTASNAGGGLSLNNCDATIRNCEIKENTIINNWFGGGGGVYCFGGNSTFVDCIIKLNSANANGGGLYLKSTNSSIYSCNISENKSWWGGGAYSKYGNLIITNCMIINNSATQGGGGILCSSGLVISDTLIKLNEANSYGGGGLYCYGSSPIVHNCSFFHNTANEVGGGAIFCRETGVPEIASCVITGNVIKDGNGGGFFCGSSPTISSCIINGNYAIDGDGGAIYADIDASIIVKNCSINCNSAFRGGGIYCGENCLMTINNNIVTENISGGGIYWIYSNPDISYNNVWNNVDGDYDGWAYPGEGDISVDPKFIDSGYWDDNGTPGDTSDDFWVNGDYHLHHDSLCINAGDPDFVPEPDETDIDGESRVRLGRVDMGADEAGSNPVDFDENGTVDIRDYCTLSAAWQTEPGDNQWNELCNIIQSADEVINALDLAAYCDEWLWEAWWYEQ